MWKLPRNFVNVLKTTRILTGVEGVVSRVAVVRGLGFRCRLLLVIVNVVVGCELFGAALPPFVRCFSARRFLGRQNILLLSECVCRLSVSSTLTRRRHCGCRGGGHSCGGCLLRSLSRPRPEGGKRLPQSCSLLGHLLGLLLRLLLVPLRVWRVTAELGQQTICKGKGGKCRL